MNRKKITSLCLASIMLLSNSAFATVTNNNADEVKAVPISIQIPITDEITVVTAKEMKFESELVKYDVKIPKVQGLKDAMYQEQLNYIMMGHAMKDIESVEKQAEELSAYSAKEGREFIPYEVFIDFDVKSNNGILSFTVTTYTMTGGANGITRVDCYNIDTVQNKAIELKDLFKADTDYKAVLNKEILKQIEVQKKSEEKVYFEGNEGFKAVSDFQNYYIQDANLVIIFPKYTIAPGYMGTPEFKIPLKSLIDILENSQAKPTVDVSDMNIIVNNKKIEASAAYTNMQGTVMVPLRAIAEALGFDVSWDDVMQSVRLGNGISLTISKDNYVYMKTAPIQLGTAPEVVDGKTFVPLSFFEKVVKVNNASIFESQIIIDNGEKVE